MAFGFTPNEWLILGLAVLFGLFIGAALMAGGGKAKARRREQAQRIADLERENERLKKEMREMESLRHAAAKDHPRDPDRAPERGPL